MPATAVKPPRLIDLTGKQMGDWRVLKYMGHQKWQCRCNCGTVRIIPGSNLRSGQSRRCVRCGYRWANRNKPRYIERYPYEYGVWNYSRKNKNFRLSCKDFLAKVGKRPSDQHRLVVRISKKRCRMFWTDGARGELLTYRGQTRSMAGWARKLGVTRAAISRRLKNGWSVTAAVSKPKWNRRSRRNKKREKRNTNYRGDLESYPYEYGVWCYARSHKKLPFTFADFFAKAGKRPSSKHRLIVRRSSKGYRIFWFKRGRVPAA